MTVDVHAFHNFVAFFITFSPRTENRYVIRVLLESDCFFPHAAVERNRQILDND
jgi:hypothetical protein